MTPLRSSSRHSSGKNGTKTPVNGDTPHTNGVNGIHNTPNGVSVDSTNETQESAGQDVTPTQSCYLDDRTPLQILRDNLAASLPMSRAETNATGAQDPEFESIAPFKDMPYIGRSMADVGYQESEYWSRPQDSYIRFYGN